MSYIINKTDGSILTTIQDGTTDTNTGLTLIGRNYISYGDAQNENFVKLLENFAGTNPPTQSVTALLPLSGTLWYDTTNQRLRVYDGVNWSNISERIVSATTPTAQDHTLKNGDQWWDTTNYQLNTWTGSSWQLVGPAYTKTQGKSGPVVEILTDNESHKHTVVNTYTNGNLISIASFDNTFTPSAPITGFDVIKPGINLLSNVTVNGRAEDSIRAGGIFANAFARVDQTSTFTQDIGVVGNLMVGFSNISQTAQDLTIRNTAYTGNIDVYVNAGVGNKHALHIDGITGILSVYNAPKDSYDVSTKYYVDSMVGAVDYSLTNSINAVDGRVNQLRGDTGNYMTANVNALNSTINNNQTAVLGTLAAVTAAMNILQANASTQQTSIDNLVVGVATTNSNIVAANVAINSRVDDVNSGMVANLATVNYNLSGSITGLALSTAANLSAAIATVAPINSPALTGTPTAPTPTAGDISTCIATTAFVAAATANQVTSKVSTLPPSGTPNYNFWFQV